jgi:hypothetical protein
MPSGRKKGLVWVAGNSFEITFTWKEACSMVAEDREVGIERAARDQQAYLSRCSHFSPKKKCLKL